MFVRFSDNLGTNPFSRRRRTASVLSYAAATCVKRMTIVDTALKYQHHMQLIYVIIVETALTYLIFVTYATYGICAEQICHAEKFPISIHDMCGEIWSFSTSRGISDFRNLIFCQMWREISNFVMKSVLSRFTLFCMEKNLANNCVCGEKITNMRYWKGPNLSRTAYKKVTSCELWMWTV